MSGLIILPDNWVLPEGAVFNASTQKGLEDQGGYYSDDEANHFNDNTYTTEQWNVMQDNGVVFLPCGGHRNGTSMNVNSNPQSAYYWSATGQGQSGAYRLFLDANYFMPQDYSSRYLGHSVRLVKDIPVPTWKVTIVQPEHGTITVEEADIDLDAVPDGTELNFVATPDEGYKLEAWDGGYPGMEIYADVTITCTFVPDDTALDEVRAESVGVRKIIVDGQVLILRGGKKFTVLGTEVK